MNIIVNRGVITGEDGGTPFSPQACRRPPSFSGVPEAFDSPMIDLGKISASTVPPARLIFQFRTKGYEYKKLVAKNFPSPSPPRSSDFSSPGQRGCTKVSCINLLMVPGEYPPKVKTLVTLMIVNMDIISPFNISRRNSSTKCATT